MAEKKKNKRVGSIIFRIVLIIIAGLTVGIGVFSWNASGLVGNQLPMPLGFGISVVMSPSMEPVLHTNDLVIVTEQESYDIDDIVVYQEGKMLVIHRIISIQDDKVITKGDANNVADTPISLSDIKAKLSFKIPFIGLIVKYLKTVPGTLLVLALAIFLLYRSRQKERQNDQQDLDEIAEEIKRLRESLANKTVSPDVEPDTSSKPDDADNGSEDVSEAEERGGKTQSLNESPQTDDAVDTAKADESAKKQQAEPQKDSLSDTETETDADSE